MSYLEAIITTRGSPNKDETLWYDREDFDPLSSGEENESSCLKKKTSERTRVRKTSNIKKLVKQDSISQSHRGATYPLDVWCLLSKYICPEHVLRFCLICKGANEALNMRSFWLRLYKRHIHDLAGLPQRLKPERIECRPGLRARVIRALFHGYEPFSTRTTLRWGDDVSSLESQLCISMWCRQVLCKKQKQYWVFYFKFSEAAGLEKSRKLQNSPFMWLDEANDTRHNSEEHHTILQVKCNNFILISPVQGLVLTKIWIYLSQDVNYNKVKLIFHSPRTDGRYRSENAVTVMLDPAMDVKILNWWDPIYPYQEQDYF